MLRSSIELTLGAAAYGFSVGLWHSSFYAARNLIKFPLLLLVTTAICALACFLSARLSTARLGFWEVQRLILKMYATTSILLASLVPVNLFLVISLAQPASRDELNDHPLFLGLNVLFIALSGSLALAGQIAELHRKHQLGRGRITAILLSWLGLSLAVGAQWAWFLRPFFGISAPLGSVRDFCLGTDPDFRGATSFYEAVYHLAFPP